MKRICILFLTAMTLLGCNSSSNAIKQVKEKAFFDYDEIEHYQTDYDGKKIVDLLDNKSHSELDSIKMEVILGNYPKDVSDVSYFERFGEIGFEKISVEKSKFERIDSIFIEKKVSDFNAANCMNVFRDILVFKKENQVVGVAKICFDCSSNKIIGTAANTDGFGQDGDYAKLAEILKK